MKKYNNIISLGFFCSVALELERIGLRNSSSPFDWVISKFSSVLELIDNDFSDFLEIEYLYQEKLKPEHYQNVKYNIGFFHDFDQYKSLEEQIDDVREKYKRRINRFYENIKEPTLFIRYISDYDECKFIEDNICSIKKRLKEFNQCNDIIFVANNSIKSEKINIYYVEPDKDDCVARRFLDKNYELLNFLSSDIYNSDLKAKNLHVYNKKKIKNKILNIPYKINRKIKKHCCKIYIHDKLI